MKITDFLDCINGATMFVMKYNFIKLYVSLPTGNHVELYNDSVLNPETMEHLNLKGIIPSISIKLHRFCELDILRLQPVVSVPLQPP